MKRIKLEVCPHENCKTWQMTIDGDPYMGWRTQAESVLFAVRHAHKLVIDGNTVTLKIKRRDGTIREERTYPRSSDPKRSKG